MISSDPIITFDNIGLRLDVLSTEYVKLLKDAVHEEYSKSIPNIFISDIEIAQLFTVDEGVMIKDEELYTDKIIKFKQKFGKKYVIECICDNVIYFCDAKESKNMLEKVLPCEEYYDLENKYNISLSLLNIAKNTNVCYKESLKYVFPLLSQFSDVDKIYIISVIYPNEYSQNSIESVLHYVDHIVTQFNIFKNKYPTITNIYELCVLNELDIHREFAWYLNTSDNVLIEMYTLTKHY